jgi:cytoskeletal protein CcmA (bactofilin family)
MFKKKHKEQYVNDEDVKDPRDIDTVRDDVETVVGPSVHVEGDFVSNGNIVVKGSVSGNVKTTMLLTTDAGSQVLANVYAADAIISGNIKGNVSVKEQLEITSTAQILGDISCQILVVEGGALIKGKISMKGIGIEDNTSSSVVKSSRSRSKKSDSTEAIVE